MPDRNKIAQNLSIEELDAFVEELVKLPGKERTLEAIRSRAAARGIMIGVMSAKSFRDTTFERHLERIRRRQDKADQIATLAGDATGARLNDANAAILAEKIFDELNTDDDEPGAEPARADLEKLEAMSRIVQRGQRGAVDRAALEARLRESDAKVAEYKARELERAEKKATLKATLTNAVEKKGGLTKDTLAQIENQLAML